MNDPGRTSASQGANRKYTADSVKARFEVRGGFAISVPTSGSPSCSDQCSPGASECVDASTARTCGNYNADPCLEWKTYSCPGGCQNGMCVGAVCPGGGTCSGHGGCNNGVCACNPGYAPPACDTCASGYSGYPSCTPCGLAGQQCCNGTTCSGGLQCINGTCGVCALNCNGKCGGAPDGCGGSCNSGCPGGVCVGTTCQACGDSGQACCPGSSCNSPYQCLGATCGCGLGNYGQFNVTDYVYPNFGPPGCSGDNSLKLKASAAMVQPGLLRVYVRKADDSVFSTAATLTLYVGNGPTCPNPVNVIKATKAVVAGLAEQTIDLTVNPYNGSWALNEVKTFWVGKDEGGFQSWRATGTVSIKRICM